MKEESQNSKVLETKLFDDKNVSSFLKEIYTTIKSEGDDIKDLMNDIGNLISDDTNEEMIGFIGPVLKDLLDVSVKNNEQYIKLATTIQKFLTIDSKINTKGKGIDKTGDFIVISDEEKEQLKDIKKANLLIDQKKIEISEKLQVLK